MEELDLSDLFPDVQPVKAAQSAAEKPEASTLVQEFPADSAFPNSGKQVPYIVVDIETVPDESRRPSFGLDKPREEPKPFVNPEIQLPDLLKQSIPKITETINSNNPSDEWLASLELWEKQSSKPRDGLFKLIENVKAARAGGGPEAEAALVKKMSLTPEYLRIVSIGIGTPDKEWAFVVDEGFGITEADLLEWVWLWIAASKSVVGFNISGFDLPAIFVRSMLLGVQPTRRFDLAPWKGEVIDLMVSRFGRSPSMGLKKLAPLYGLEVPDEECDGSRVYELWQAGKRDEIRRYQLSDIVVTRDLLKLYQGFFC